MTALALATALLSGPSLCVAQEVAPVSIENTESVRVALDTSTINALAAAIATNLPAAESSATPTGTVIVAQVGSLGSGAIDAAIVAALLAAGAGLLWIILSLRGRV